ncbi:hypothetical protein B0H19DRAFT_431311 [Mycena capillaripes]|nr:hypothetical protein B0H19DRAFT_431311 [Mycena capillaripes]
MLRGLLRATRLRNIETYNHCLPVFYANLDPAAIPMGDNLATLPVIMAIKSLYALWLLEESHLPLGMDLWPRIWAWLLFLHTYRDCLPSNLFAGHHISLELCFFIWYKQSQTSALIGRTPGVRTLVIQAWTAIFKAGNQHHPAFCLLAALLKYFLAAYGPKNLSEVVEAAEGPGGLACLVVEYYQWLSSTPQTADQMYVHYDGITGFLLDASNCAAEAGGVDIFPALVSVGTLVPFTSVMCAISGSTTTGHNRCEFFLDCFHVLESLLEAGSYHALGDAIAAGLFQALIRASVACDGAEDLEETALWRLLYKLLPAATVYRTVLSQVESQLPGVDDIATEQAFQNSRMYENWAYFVDMAHTRIDLMNEFKSEEHVSLKACDNMDCWVIQAKGEFRRCSYCQRVFYYSPACQRLDWATGGHRDMCHSLRVHRLKNPIGTRDLTFMRFLFAHDTSKVEHQRLCSGLSSMRTHPGDPILQTVDYVRRYPKRYIDPLEKERARDKHGDVCWEEHVTRAARSGGRMELHLMRVWDGNRTRRWMFPRRSDCSTLHNGLIRILHDIHSDDAREEVKKLLMENGDVVQIYL